MSTVLVTGGTGLLGRRVVRRLTAVGHSVRILSPRAVAPPAPDTGITVGDLRTGDGLQRAVAGGPDVLTMADAARGYLAAVHRRRPVVEVPVPGAFSRALRAGANLVPGNRAGGRTWAQFLAGQSPSVLSKG